MLKILVLLINWNIVPMRFVTGCQCQNFVMPDVYVKEGDDAVIPCQWESEVVVSGKHFF